MSVKLRLKRMGSKKRPFYRLIAADSRKPRDGRFIETLGYYDPVANPATLRVDEESVFKWFERGATPTTSAASLLRQLGYMQKWELMKQGIAGEELTNRMTAIMTQREKTSAQRESRKTGQPSAKARAKAKAASEAEVAEKTEEAAEAKPAEPVKPAEPAKTESAAADEPAEPAPKEPDADTGSEEDATKS